MAKKQESTVPFKAQCIVYPIAVAEYYESSGQLLNFVAVTGSIDDAIEWVKADYRGNVGKALPKEKCDAIKKTLGSTVPNYDLESHDGGYWFQWRITRQVVTIK